MKCHYKKTDNEICKNNSLKNDKFCYWHSKKITEAEKNMNRSKGGMNKVIKCNSDFPEYELNNISEVCKLNATLINSVLQNKTDLRIATGICYLLNLQLKIIEVTTVENRISAIEDKIINNNYDLLQQT